jgi:hypothetical protein
MAARRPRLCFAQRRTHLRNLRSGRCRSKLHNYWADARRQNELVLGGDHILRFPSVAIRLEPDVVVAQLRAAGMAFGLIKSRTK